MTHYVDGFVFPIPRANLAAYNLLMKAVAGIWKEHGALDYREYVSDEVSVDGTRRFSDLAATADDEVVVFGWVEFESRASRDLINRKVAADSRIPGLIASSNSGFDAERMFYGGFRPLESQV